MPKSESYTTYLVSHHSLDWVRFSTIGSSRIHQPTSGLRCGVQRWTGRNLVPGGHILSPKRRLARGFISR